MKTSPIVRPTTHSRTQHHLAAAAALLALSATLSPATADPPRYTAQFISPNFPLINAAAMNEHGDVVGTAPSGTGGWVSLAGAPAAYLPLPTGAVSSVANDINEAGVIAGAVHLSGSLQGRACTWTPDGSGGYTVQLYGVLPGHISSGATALNNVGDLVGSSHNGTFSIPVYFTAAGAQSLQATGVFNPRDINDSRILLDVQCRRLDLDTMIVQSLGFPSPGYIGAVGEVINKSGQVAGSAVLATSTDCDHQAARYTDVAGWEIFSICGPDNSVWDMNDRGDVVMRLNVAPYVRFEGEGAFLIEDLIDTDIGHWSIINGSGITINNRRQLVVPASNQVAGQAGLILLTTTGACPVDINNDGAVNSADIAAYLTRWLTDLTQGTLTADFNADGTTNSADISAFLSAWLIVVTDGC
jgi:hypothetical protein